MNDKRKPRKGQGLARVRGGKSTRSQFPTAHGKTKSKASVTPPWEDIDVEGEVEGDEDVEVEDDDAEVEIEDDDADVEVEDDDSDVKIYRDLHRKNQLTKEDLRQQLFNEGETGPIEGVQVSTDRIVQLNGIVYDLDPQLYAKGPLTQGLSRDPKRFYKRVVRPWLDRHPLLKNCEVRATGTGVHAILWINPPIKFDTEADRNRWAGIVKVVQAALPIDPDQPGITATTRALGSINSKKGAKVRRLTKGKPVTEEQVLSLFDTMCSAPFKTVFSVLTGSDSVSPCPICRGEGTKLSALDYAGSCYGSCGTVKLETLYDLVLAPRPAKKEDRQDAKKTRKAE